MGWWSRVRSTKAEQWYLGALVAGEGVPGQGQPIRADDSYVHVFLESLFISSVRKGLTRFYGAVTSTCSMPSARGEPATSVVVTTPNGLKNADAKHLDRVVVDRIRLFGPTPYIGGDLEIEAGLFSTPSADLLAPYLSVIEDIASLAAVPYVAAAKPFVEPVTRGLKLLLGDTDGKSELEIGLTRLFAPPNAGWFAVARIPTNAGSLKYDASLRMLTLNGQPVTEPHMVLSIEATTERGDWYSIPTLLDAWNDIKRAAEQQDLNQAERALAGFRVRAQFCPDLIPADAESLITKAEERVRLAFPATGTKAISKESPGFPDLVELDLYG